MSTKLGDNMYDQQISDKFNYGIIGPEHSALFALELEKIAEFDFVYTLASTNINESAPNLVEMYVTIRSQMSYTTDLIRTEHLQLFALDLEKLL